MRASSADVVVGEGAAAPRFDDVIKICLFASTPDLERLEFPVRLLTGELDELAPKAVAWGYDGIEFLPDPENLPDPERLRRGLADCGAVMPVVNTGRFYSQGLTLAKAAGSSSARIWKAYDDAIAFAGYLGANIGLGIARGVLATPETDGPELQRVGDEMLARLARRAEAEGVVIMLEAAERPFTDWLATMSEVMACIDRIASPALSVMLDTYQLATAEDTITGGIASARGLARHIHLYDPSRRPPGIRSAEDRLDWPAIAESMRAADFEGSASVVLAPVGDPSAPAKRSAAFLRSLFSHENGGGQENQ